MSHQRNSCKGLCRDELVTYLYPDKNTASAKIYKHPSDAKMLDMLKVGTEYIVRDLYADNKDFGSIVYMATSKEADLGIWVSRDSLKGSDDLNLPEWF